MKTQNSSTESESDKKSQDQNNAMGTERSETQGPDELKVHKDHAKPPQSKVKRFFKAMWGGVKKAFRKTVQFLSSKPVQIVLGSLMLVAGIATLNPVAIGLGAGLVGTAVVTTITGTLIRRNNAHALNKFNTTIKHDNAHQKQEELLKSRPKLKEKLQNQDLQMHDPAKVKIHEIDTVEHKKLNKHRWVDRALETSQKVLETAATVTHLVVSPVTGVWQNIKDFKSAKEMIEMGADVISDAENLNKFGEGNAMLLDMFTREKEVLRAEQYMKSDSKLKLPEGKLTPKQTEELDKAELAQRIEHKTLQTIDAQYSEKEIANMTDEQFASVYNDRKNIATQAETGIKSQKLKTGILHNLVKTFVPAQDASNKETKEHIKQVEVLLKSKKQEARKEAEKLRKTIPQGELGSVGNGSLSSEAPMSDAKRQNRADSRVSGR